MRKITLKPTVRWGLGAILLATTSAHADIPLPTDTCPVATYEYAMPKYIAGDPLAAGANGATEPALLLFPDNANGKSYAGGTAISKFSTAAQIGSVWGTATQSTATGKKIYTAAILKRHVGLGAHGLGAIYVSDTATGDGSTAMTTTKFVDLVADFGINVGQAQVPTNSTRGLPADKMQNSVDADVFPLIGKVGLGDLDIDEAQSNLFTVNLFDKKVYKINIASGTGGTPTSYSIPAGDGGAGTEMRPWGLEIAGGKLYAGVVYTPASGGNKADMKAAIYQLDLVTGTWAAAPILTFALDYPRGNTIWSVSGEWNPWEDNYNNFVEHSDVAAHPQPLLSDMELDATGAFHIAMMDRAGHQLGHRNSDPSNSSITTGISAGDILRTWNDNGTIRLENKGAAGTYTSNGTGTSNQGPGGINAPQGPGGGEFYWDDYIDTTHGETGFGGLAIKLDSKKLASSIMDPLEYDAGGMQVFNTDNGASLQEYQVYQDAGSDVFINGKANGLGDIETLCAPVAPPCSINTPTVTAECNNNGTPSNATDDKFTYKITATGSNVGATYSISGGDTYANRSYGTEHISTNSFPISGGNLALTLTDDTTASCKLENVTITVPSTCSSSAPSADLEVTKTANVSSAKSGDTVIYTVKIKNNGPDTATGVEVTDQLPAGVTYASHNTGQGTYTFGTGLWTVGTLANGATATLTINVTIK